MSSTIDREEYERMARQLKEPGVSVELRIRIHADGAMSVSGPIHELELCLQMLEEAKEAIKRNHRVTPAKDVGVKVPG